MDSSPRRTRAFTIVGGAAAAATAAFVASRLGVNGTIVGAAVASIVASIGAEVYGRAVTQSAEAVSTLAQRTRAVAPAPDDPAEPDADDSEVGDLGSGESVDDEPPEPTEALRFSWQHVALVAVGVFVVVLAAITVVEVVIGKPISSLWGRGSSSGTSIGDVVRPPTTPVPSVAPTSTPPATSVPTQPPASNPPPTASPQPTPTVTVTVTAPPATSPDATPTTGG